MRAGAMRGAGPRTLPSAAYYEGIRSESLYRP